MKKQLLFAAALGLVGFATAQELNAVQLQSGKHSIVRKSADNGLQRSSVFSENFATGFGQFTSSFGPTSTAPHWTYNSNQQYCLVSVGTTAETTRTFEEYLTMTNAVTVPADADVYRLEPTVMLNKYWLLPGSEPTAGGGRFEIQMSNDNGTSWQTFWTEDDAAMLASTFTSDFPETSGFVDVKPRIAVPAAYRGVPIKVRFALTGTLTAAAYVKDVQIKSVSSEIVEVIDVINGDIVNLFEYKKIPVEQVEPVTVLVGGKNLGFGPVNRDVFIDIAKLNGSTATSVYTQTITGHSFPLGIADTVTFTTGYVPTEVAEYRVRAILVAGDVAMNDTMDTYFQVTDYAYGQADLFEIDQFFTQEGSAVGYGQRFHTKVDASLFGFNAYVYSGSTVDQNLGVFVRRSTETGWQEIYQGEYVLTSTDITTSISNLKRVYIPLEYELEIGAEEVIMIELRQTGSNVLRLLATEGDNDYGTLLYGPFGVGAAVNWYRGWDVALALEADFQNRLAVEKIEGMDNVVVFPNPSTGIFNINNSSNEVLNINVMDITGKQVSTASVYGQGSIDLSTFGSGVYVLEISNGLTRSSKRVIVK